MKLVYFGTGTFAVPALQRLAPHVVLAVAQPDRPSGRGMRLHPTPVKLAATELGIPVETPEKARAPEFVELLQSLEADALIVASYGQILSTKVLNSAKQGGINLHGSILPAYRGAAPIQRAILNGDPETGVTLMQMDRGMDTGDMIDLVTTPIGPDESYGELQDRLALLAADLITSWIERIAAGDYPRTPQPEEGVTHAPKIDRAETELSLQRPAAAEYNRLRAFTPSPGVFLATDQGSLKVHKARPIHGVSKPVGTVIATEEGRPIEGLGIAFAEGALDLIEVQPEGKKRMSGRDYANGARLRPGARLG